MKQSDTDTKILDALGKGDRESAERLAHTLRSIAGNIGMDGVQSAARTRKGRGLRVSEKTRFRLHCRSSS